MNFRTFPVAFTNIFPASNTKKGGQLLTEYNLRSREMVGTPRSIEYEVGLSYVHNASDFEVRTLSDEAGVPVSLSTLEIMPGRGIINGHFVETLSPMTIDLVEANAKLQKESKAPLKGKLAIGIRVFYATSSTIAGTILMEDENEMYQGVQLVVLPEAELILPFESPTDRNKVTAHLRLATFTFNNNRITGIVNCDDTKCQYIAADRIANIDSMLSDVYVRKTGLNSKKIYAFAGKGTNPATGYDTWEDVTDSLMVWDKNPQRTLVPPQHTQAQFTVTGNNVYLTVPHKQVDSMKDSQGTPEYYASRNIPLPVADYSASTPGIVDKKYTAYVKELSGKLDQFRRTLNGKQIMFIEVKDADTVLPPINPAWNIGDYILVDQDYTADDNSDGIRPPSTLYVVLPGLVQTISFHSVVSDSQNPPADLTGVCLGNLNYSAEDRDEEPSTSDDPTTYPVFFTEDDLIRGVPNKDYFTVTYLNGSNYKMFYYNVATAGSRAYSPYVPLTGEIPFAQENVIGGFLNVSTDAIDNGYVYRDEYGRLRLLDYGLLRSGVLAYQLGQDITFPTGLSNAELQQYLNEYVNQRVAFPNAAQIESATTPDVINLFITLEQTEEPSTITICDIDSRFNTPVYLHFLGNADSNTTINIIDCEKIRIDNDIQGSPIINIYRSCLYYDAYVMNYIRQAHWESTFTGFQDLRLWYQMYEDSDPHLLVDNMTVSELDAPVIPDDIDYWHTSEANDNHYLVALNSITFSGDGDIVKCGLYLANESTDNVDPGEKIIVGEFELPQGAGLSYPKTCLTRQLKVVGTFVSTYYADDTWYVTNTSFGAITSTYNPYDMTIEAKGNIAFHSNTTLVRSDIGTTVIPVWETDTYSIFYGGTIN